MKRTSRQPRGAALIIALLVMAVLLLAGTTFLTISSTENAIALNERVSAQAFLLGEAGLHKAIAQLNSSSTYSGETNTSLGSGSFTTTVTTVAGCTATSARDVVATGTVPVAGGQAQVQVRAVLDQIVYPYRWGAFATVPNLIVTGGRREKELWLKDNGASDSFDSTLGAYDATTNRGTTGNIGANGDITLERNTAISGSVSAGDAIHMESGVTISGSQTTGAAAKSFPSITPSTTPTQALNIGNNQTVNFPAGTYYYTSIDIGNNSTITTSGGLVTIYVTGEVDIGNSVTIGANPGTNLEIIAKSDGADTSSVEFEAGNTFTFYGSFYGKNTDVDLGNDAKIYGSMLARTIKMGNNATIHYDLALGNKSMCTSGKYLVKLGTWREVIPGS
jgi:Tfp pilus assembly protein PilX